jgi:hypothetical protein
MIELLPMKAIRSFNFSFDKNYYALEHPNVPLSIKGLDDMLRPSYCCLLKIREIALKNSVSKEKYTKNVQVFIDWMVEELDIVMGVEFKLAVNVFGGETSFRRMINLDGKSLNTTKSLLGTAWDICHYRMFANSENLSKIVSEDSFPIFVTKDEPFYELVKSTIKGNHKIGSSLMMDFEKPRFSDEPSTDFFNERMLVLAAQRFGKEVNYDEDKVLRLIGELEMENDDLTALR